MAHKLQHLVKYAATHKHARFYCKSMRDVTIWTVLTHPHNDWDIFDSSIKQTEAQRLQFLLDSRTFQGDCDE